MKAGEVWRSGWTAGCWARAEGERGEREVSPQSAEGEGRAVSDALEPPPSGAGLRQSPSLAAQPPPPGGLISDRRSAVDVSSLAHRTAAAAQIPVPGVRPRR
ncbi:Hypothetical protein NTJ_03536 [Nesidiocoris tenuis]|uniref:Uncharacterized protein n=1 Tax=Nesidiocoris tenuis TaxID=355587 RepID=A0ABN7AFG5_9HEMI|nr:Hypothetical protein NTJ_03536 [Nesidiocoris tenuis]